MGFLANEFTLRMNMGEDGNRLRVLNFQKLCRICLQEKRVLVSIYDSVDDNYNVAVHEKIMACALINLSRGDGLPDKICIPCLSSLNATFEFRLQCENSDRTLHLLLNNQTGRGYVEKSKSPRKIHENKFGKLIVIRRENRELHQNHKSNCPCEKEQTENKVIKKLSYVMNILKKSKENRNDMNLSSFARNDSVETVGKETEGKEGIHENLYELAFPVESSCSTGAGAVMKGHSEGSKGQKKASPVGKRVLSEGKKSSCPFCHKMLFRVNEHIRLLHRNRVYICKKQDCSAQFLTLKNLQSHQLRCFNMKKPYKCSSCSKEFYRKCNYNAHTRRHSKEKDFLCQLCEKAFVDSTGLRRHFLKHHEPQQELYVVGCCGKKFKTKRGLRQHVQKGICGLQLLHFTDSRRLIT